MNESDKMLERPAFPRSAKYGADWMLDNQMGPNAVWLAEWLCEALPVESGMRVLDLGCGKALTSVFLAREFGARVIAADWWIGPDHNWARAVDAGVADRVIPVRAEAHALPFAAGFFDAVISVDAYHYFGTDQLYLGYLAGFVREGGWVGVAAPGLMQPIETEPPAHLTEPQANGAVFWEDECWSFRTADWWRSTWSRCGKADSVRVDTLDDGWKYWRDFEAEAERAGKNVFPSVAETLDRDRGEYLGFVRAIARRNEKESMNIYDPSIGVKFGVDR